jgi:hypothetical protein
MPSVQRLHTLTVMIIVLTFSVGLVAQDNPAAAPHPTPKPPAKSTVQAPPHKFWDTENICLFAGVGGVRMLDYASTRYLRGQGNNEWLLSNSIVDNRPLFVGIELAGTAASIGVSYLFHRTGHQTLERWVSVAHIGVGVGGSIRNYSLKPPMIFGVQPVGTGLTIQPAR